MRAHVFVSGKVQGVFFRDTTARVARELGVRGFVRNLTDGRVEAVFEGPKTAVEECVVFCRRGPPGARVADVRVAWEADRSGFAGFDVRPTGDP